MTKQPITYATLRGTWYTEDGIIDDLAGDLIEIAVINGRAYYADPALLDCNESIRVAVDSITGPYFAFPAATFSPDPGELERVGIVF